MLDPGISRTPGSAGEVRVHAQEVSRGVKERARDARDEFESRAEERKQEMAGRIHSVARALRDTGDALDREDERQLARFGHDAADAVERAAGYMERQDLRGLIHDVEDTGRRNPGALLAGSLAAGLAVGRFLRASGSRSHDDRDANTTQEVDRG